jgi:hypothetical protein
MEQTFTNDDNACYLPGWDDGPGGLYCELAGDHDGQHSAFIDDPDPEFWDVTWVVDDEDFPFGD